MHKWIRDIVDETMFIDTHEHLLEESTRLAGVTSPLLPAPDWSNLLGQYVSDDLISAGMAPATLQSVLAGELSAEQKVGVLEPWWQRTRQTGYGLALRLSLKALYGEDDISIASAGRIAEKYADRLKPGFYRPILRDMARIEHCQVNSLERIFMESAQPELLRQDLSFVEMARCGPHDLALLERETGLAADSLEGWLAIIDEMFARYGAHAVAIKNQSAYARRLDYLPVSKARAATAFAEMISPWGQYSPDSARLLHDFCFRYCVGKAGEYGLPVKLHTGYYAGQGPMPLGRLRENATDIGQLLLDFPDTTFVLMHIGYPYENEQIALVKRHPNAVVDMCWAWIINPAASVRFLREYLMAAPASKLLSFGGDHIMVEHVVGHSMVARRGIAEALSGLVDGNWIDAAEVRPLVERLMNGNARDIFANAGTARPSVSNA